MYAHVDIFFLCFYISWTFLLLKLLPFIISSHYLALVTDYKNCPNPSFLHLHAFNNIIFQTDPSKSGLISPPLKSGLALWLVLANRIDHVSVLSWCLRRLWVLILLGFLPPPCEPAGTGLLEDERTQGPSGPSVNLELTLHAWRSPTKSTQLT